MKQSLKTVFNEHVNEINLSEKQLDHLMAMQNDSAEDVANAVISQAKPRFYQMPALVASVLLMLSVMMGFHLLKDVAESMSDLIAQEVANNHLHLKPLEVETNELDNIRGFLDKLDFTPVQSELLAQTDKAYLGARYCSIQGVRAAQIRLQDVKTGEIQSLYETVYDRSVFPELPALEEGAKPLSVYAQGMQVKIWVEKGLLFALTQEQ